MLCMHTYREAMIQTDEETRILSSLTLTDTPIQSNNTHTHTHIHTHTHHTLTHTHTHTPHHTLTHTPHTTHHIHTHTHTHTHTPTHRCQTSSAISEGEDPPLLPYYLMEILRKNPPPTFQYMATPTSR